MQATGRHHLVIGNFAPLRRRAPALHIPAHPKLDAPALDGGNAPPHRPPDLSVGDAIVVETPQNGILRARPWLARAHAATARSAMSTSFQSIPSSMGSSTLTEMPRTLRRCASA